MKAWFENIESDEEGTQYPLQALVSELNFNDDGLIPVIAQDAVTKDVLMFAWMNEDALNETIANGRMCYWSRSRKTLWRKGESSGHAQQLVELRTDCDGDVLLALIDQTGAACHTNRRSCFYLKFNGQSVRIDSV